jgi:hypothetical protein
MLPAELDVIWPRSMGRSCVFQFLLGVALELLGDRHVLGALEDLRINHVGDNRLVLTGQVFIQKIDQLLTAEKNSAVPRGRLLRPSGSPFCVHGRHFLSSERRFVEKSVRWESRALTHNRAKEVPIRSRGTLLAFSCGVEIGS